MYLKIKFISIYLLFIITINANSKVVINEFQPIPIDEEPEWIELFNYSDKLIIFDSLKINDNKTSKNIGKFTFLPNVFYIFTKDTNDLKLKYPNLVTKSNQILFEINFPSLNNTTDEIKILNGTKLIDSLYYDMKLGIRGNSFERVSNLIPANENGNLKPSRSRFKATPFEINSWTKVDYDLEIESMSVKKTYLFDNTYTSNLEVIVSNFGLFNYDKSKLNISLIYNDNITSLINFEINSLNVNNKQTFNFDITDLISQTNYGGNLKFKASLGSSNDQRNTNDTLILTYYIAYQKGSLIINEFITDVNNDVNLYSDTVTNIEKKVMGEFIEIYNNSIFEINLKNYIIDDASTFNQNSGIKIEKDLILKPKEFGLVTWDTAFFKTFDSLNLTSNELYNKIYYTHKPSFNLNIATDNLILKDEFQNVIDSISYSEKWNSNIFKSTKNISLERVNPNGDSNDEINWSTCLDILGATPLKKNSISNDNKISIDNIEIMPNPFSPKNGGINSNCKISYNFNFQYLNLTVKVFDLYGNIIANLIENRALPSNYTIIWEGTDNSGKIIPVGAYVVMVEAVDNISGSIKQLKKMIAIGE